MRLSLGCVAVLFIAVGTALLVSAAASPPESTSKPGSVSKSAAVMAARTAPERTGTAEVRVLGVNDLHGHLESPGRSGGRAVGGAAYVAAHLDRHEARNTIRVHAGDMVGASPLASSHFRDEPTIEVMNVMGFDVGVLGNHEFDGGTGEMMRLIEGGVRGGDSPASERKFPGASFPHLAANVVDRRTGETILPAYRVIERDGARIGFIGVVTPETLEITAPEVSASLAFLDMSETVNRYAGELRKEGVEAVVVLAHSGGSQRGGVVSGEVVDEAEKMDGSVDAIFAGHTHKYMNARVGNAVLVEGGEYGEAITAVDLEIDRATGEVVSSSAEIIPTYNDEVPPDPEVRALVRRYAERVAPLSNRVVGTAAQSVLRATTEAGESPLGALIADAIRKRTGADFAFVLQGALRDDLEAGGITVGDLSLAYPGADTLMTVSLTGQQVREVLESQYRNDRLLQVSGLRFTHDPSRPLGSRVTSVTLPGGAPLDPNGTYSVAAKGFVAKGGVGFEVFEKGESPEEHGTELDALAGHIESLPQPFEAPDPEREKRIQHE